MFVRVKDKKHNNYYKSMVYCLINTGYYEKAILFNPFTRCFELIDCLDKESKDLCPLYECINNNRDNWISHKNAYLLKIKKFFKCKEFEASIQLLQGYPEVINDYAFILKMLKYQEVALSETTQEIRNNEDEQEWNYIRNQDDADEFMKLFVGFHDATLDKMSYEENYSTRQLNVIFDNSGWYGVVELCFEGLLRMNLRAFSENYSREIYNATLKVSDETVYWADGETISDNYQFNGTWIKALNLKWKKIK